MAAQSYPDRFEGFHLNGPTSTRKSGWRTRNGRVTFEFGRTTDEAWDRFRARIGLALPPGQAEDWRALTGLGDRADDAKDLIEAAFRDWDSEPLVDAIRECGGLGAPWLTYRELAAHPQLAAERMLVDVPHGQGPPLRLVGWPWSAGRTPATLRSPAPALGEHTAALPELLAEPEPVAGDPGLVPSRRPLGRDGLAGPLQGLRVVDLSQGGVGPWASALLAAMGADVIRVEPPTGDFIRAIGPTQRGMSTTYLKNSYGKRATTLNLKDPDDLRAARRIADTADVLLENLRPGVAAKLGMGYDAVRATNPRIVYVSASGYGQRGPLRDAGCTDPHMQAFSGTANLHGVAGGSPELFRFFGYLDLNTAQVIVQAILLGLVARDRLGVGQRIETSMLHAALALQAPNWACYAVDGELPGPLGSRSRWLAPDEAFVCKDHRPIALTVASDDEWAALCAALELPDDPRFADNAGRLAHAEDLREALGRVFATRPSGWWLWHLGRAGLRVGPFLGFGEIRGDERFLTSGYVEEIDTPWGPVCNGGPPWRFSATPARFLPPHEPGADTAEVIAETKG
jgi:CoA:oxalate CoA-transferase